MKFIQYLLELWRMPWFNYRLGAESKELTGYLEALMYFNVQPDKISDTKLLATFDGIRVWLGNYPYASYTLFDDKRIPRLLPSRRTNYRFNKYINNIILGGLSDKTTSTKTSV